MWHSGETHSPLGASLVNSFTWKMLVLGGGYQYKSRGQTDLSKQSHTLISNVNIFVTCVFSFRSDILGCQLHVKYLNYFIFCAPPSKFPGDCSTRYVLLYILPTYIVLRWLRSRLDRNQLLSLLTKYIKTPCAYRSSKMSFPKQVCALLYNTAGTQQL